MSRKSKFTPPNPDLMPNPAPFGRGWCDEHQTYHALHAPRKLKNWSSTEVEISALGHANDRSPHKVWS